MYDKLQLYSHVYWYDMAKSLKYSANILYEKLELLLEQEYILENRKQILSILRAYMLLMGFSLENLVKGISIKVHFENLIVENFDKLDDSKKFKILKEKIWRTNDPHDISQIAISCSFGFTFYDAEIDLFTRHKQFTVWAGRYPIPKTNIQKEYDISAFKSSDKVLIENLFTRAKAFL